MAYEALDLYDSTSCDLTEVIHLGDHWDMPSLSSWNKRGSIQATGQDIQADIDAGNRALDLIQDIWDRYWFTPRKTLLLGNHENRIKRATDEDPKLKGLLKGWDQHAKDLGWNVVQFQRPRIIDRIAYCHYFDIGPNGQATGRGAGQPSAKMQLARVGTSCVAGHRQGLDIATRAGNGVVGPAWSVIAGSFYLHQEEYRGPTDGQEWRGIVVLNDIRKGTFEPMPLSMDYLKRKHGHRKE